MRGFYTDKLFTFSGYWLLRFILLLILQSLSSHGPIIEKGSSFLSTWIDMVGMRKKFLAVNKGRDRFIKRHRQGCQFLTTGCLAVCRSPCQEFCDEAIHRNDTHKSQHISTELPNLATAKWEDLKLSPWTWYPHLGCRKMSIQLGFIHTHSLELNSLFHKSWLGKRWEVITVLKRWQIRAQIY